MLSNYVDLLSEFIKTDFKHRYKNSFLGFLWMVIKPLALFSILYFVWSAIMKTRSESALFLLSGVMLIGYFNDGVTLGLNSLLSKAHIILKIDFPRDVVILSSTLVSVINFLVNFAILIIFTLFGHYTITFVGMLLAILSIITLYVFILGLSFFLSVWNIIVKDLHHIVELALQMMFWATPVLYEVKSLPVTLQKIIWFNPVAHILEAFRLGLLHGDVVKAQNFVSILIVLGISGILAITGYLYFKPNVKKIAEFF